MVYCIAEFQAKSGRENELFEVLKSLEEKTCKEKGCIQYIVMKKIKNEFAKGKSKGIIFNEIWETAEDFNAHNKASHIEEFFQKHCLNKNGSANSWNINLFEK
ncbi:MAG: antibiotic biosynthesis monooxygenase [Sulfurospirillum sp.]|nr:antibiotic biosynthesis monooxygenase [Sulfurospirillum sp.]MBL0702756.1 antibiotic biosynthesis monooxygenase [Sulfurospirillum sp.]